MRAVYGCSDNPYLTLSLEEIVPLVDTEYVALVPSRRGFWEIPSSKAIYRIKPESLQFLSGTLTLTDPTEIKGMREYIKRRQDDFITELSFEGNEAELERVSHIIKASPTDPQRGSGVPQGTPQRHKVNRADEWDHKMAQRLRR